MSFPRYAEYVDSGVEWLGAIPKHWHSAKVWMYFELGRGRVISNEEIQDFSGEYPVYSSQTKDNGVMGKLNTFDFEGDYITWTTDGANAGTVSRRSGKFNCTNVCGTMKPLQRTMWLDFYAYALSRATCWFVRHDINPKLMNNVVSSIPIPILPFKEQTQIARFLDHETAKIDALIAEQKRLIKLLQEKRQAVISHAVTKGLDPNVPMKDSGVEWLGEVPAHWNMLRVKFLSTRVSTGGTPTQPSPSEEYVDGLNWFSPGDFKESIVINDSKKKLEYDSLESNNAVIFPSNSVLVVGIGATLGKVAVTDAKFSTNQQINIICPLPSVIKEFLAYSLSVKREAMRVLSNASTIGIMNQEKTKEIPIPIPQSDEQKSIYSYIETELENLSLLVNSTEISIDLLNERRSALISAAVTGKIDVRDWQPPVDESAFDEDVQKAGMEASA